MSTQGSSSNRTLLIVAVLGLGLGSGLSQSPTTKPDSSNGKLSIPTHCKTVNDSNGDPLTVCECPDCGTSQTPAKIHSEDGTAPSDEEEIPVSTADNPAMQKI